MFALRIADRNAAGVRTAELRNVSHGAKLVGEIGASAVGGRAGMLERSDHVAFGL